MTRRTPLSPVDGEAGQRPCLSRKVAPAYAAISAKLQANLWRTGAHIKPDVLADRLGISITPIREALQRLSGERMVDFRRGKGYYVRHFDAVDIAECYEVIGALVTFSVINYGASVAAPRIREAPPLPSNGACPSELARYGETQAAWLEAQGLALVSLADNREMRRILHRCQARTHVIRVLECQDRHEGSWVFSSLQEGVGILARNDIGTVHAMLRAYFSRRAKRIPELVERANRIGQAAPLP